MVFAVGAADYTWQASPVSGNWLTDANWDQGAWDETATANAAIFGASSQTSVDVNGDVTAASVTVDGADYTFGGAGTLMGARPASCTTRISSTRSTTTG